MGDLEPAPIGARRRVEPMHHRGESTITFPLAAGAPTPLAVCEEPTATGEDAQLALLAVITATIVLDEVAFLLRQLRAVVVAACESGSAGQVREWQSQVQALVREVAGVAGGGVVAGGPVLGGRWSCRTVSLPTDVGAAVSLDIARLDTRVLGLERPWGYATKAHGPPARLTAASGILPDGVFTIARGDVLDSAGVRVGAVEGCRVVFACGVTATFDRSPAYRDDQGEPASGCLTLAGVLSVRSAAAAEGAVLLIDEAAAEVSRRRQSLEVMRRQLDDVLSDAAWRAGHRGRG